MNILATCKKYELSNVRVAFIVDINEYNAEEIKNIEKLSMMQWQLQKS